MDDGYIGTNFQRPGVQEGFELVKQGLVGCWLCKDYCAIIGLNQKELENQGILA